MEKVIVIGSPGAGKSTFARKLRDAIHLPLYYLDQLWHKPDQTNISREEFDMRLEEWLQRDRWIMDGNYQRTLEMRMQVCDTIFLLDFPVETCLMGAKSRVGKKREDLPWVESEFDEEFRQEILAFPEKQLPQIYQLIGKYGKEKEVVIFRSREEVNRYLQEMGEW
ncbi:MAG: adenylate kinase [Lachnospiraceae bacterium]|nr:adenylate kinase [Lachnospiraceae bacterium]